MKFFTISIITLTTLTNLLSQCSGTVYDNGGSSSNYTNNANVTTTYTATSGNMMRLTFNAFNTQLNNDYLRVYDGPNTSSTLIATLSGNKNSSLPTPITSTGQTITIRFTSNSYTTASGYSISLSCVASCSNTTSGGTIAGDQTVCGTYDPSNVTSSTAASGGSGTITYQWESSLNNSTWSDISGATGTTYDPASITQTTYYRRKSKTNTCTGWGAISNVITKIVNPLPTSNAGSDISQCENGAFQLIGNNPGSGQTSAWSVVSGGPLTYQSLNNDSIVYSIQSGQTATLRYTVTQGACSSSDNVVITNTTGCTTTCLNAINSNGDLETEGNATNFPLSFQSTPASLINSSNYIPGWEDIYDGNSPNTTSFTGAYYIKKTGSNGEPHSGTHMIYLNGTPFKISAASSNTNVSCGKTYKFTAWAAAYTNSATQTSTPFALGVLAESTSGSPVNYLKKIELLAPASTSWNDLNWQRYEFTITIPANGYQFADFYFSTLNNTSGIVIDDVCITEVFNGSHSFAGNDILACSNGITLGATPAASGYTGTWSVVSGSTTFSNANLANAIGTISSGTNSTLRWTVSNGSCSSTDEVVIGYTSSSGVTVNDDAICTGWSTTLTATNCSGNLLWSNGATTSSITVSPSSTTSYSVTCTPTQTANLILNGGFESSSDFGNWTNQNNAGITNTSGEYRSGSKGARITASSAWGGFYQNITANSGQFYTVSFWAKMNNTNATGYVTVRFLNSSSTQISGITTQRVNSTGWVKYTLTALSPINTAFVQVSAEADAVSNMYVDDVEVYRSTGCTSTDIGTVTVITNDNITLGTPVVSSAIDQPLLDVATVSVQVSWTSPPANDKIKVVHNDKAEYINVGGGATSPQTVTFIVEADGDNNKVISASWLNNPNYACTKYINFSTPNPINNQKIGCDILFLCGLDKPYDGDPFDHGMINYIIENSTGTLTTALTKTDATGYGLYDWANQSTLLSINLDNYDLVIVSATTEGHLATGIYKALAGWKGSVLNMNYDMMQELGYAPNNYVSWQTYGYNNSGIQEELLNYDNINPTYGYVLTQGDYYPQAVASTWSTSTGASTGLGGIFFKYSAHSNPNLNSSSTHGSRVYLGYHMNGIYANSINGGALPAPISTYFSPMKHLTLKGKEILDNALIAASTCGVEICSNDIDDDGDGLSDCYDPDCGQVINREFESGSTGWSIYQQNGATAVLTIDNTGQVSGYNSARINTTVATGTDWHVQFAQTGKSIVAGTTYKFSFKAKAASNRTMSSAVDLGVSPYTSYLWNNASLTTSVQTFSYTFTPTVTVSNNIRTLFNLGTTAGNVYIDDVRLEEVCSVFSCAIGDCETSNQVVNGSFTTNINNWTATNGELSLGTGGTYGNFVVLNNPDYNNNYYVYQDITIGANKSYKFNGYFAKHGSGNNAKMYLEFYNGTTLLSKSTDIFTTYNFDGNFQAIPTLEGTTPANTTKIRIVGYAKGTALKFDEISLVTCSQNTSTAGTISGNQSECGNYVPSQITSATAATGGSGTIDYQWEVSTDSLNWISIASSNSANYTPGLIYQTSYFRRKSKSSSCNEWSNYSNVIKKEDFGFDNFQVLTEGNQTYTGGAHIHGATAMGGDLTINSSAKVEFAMDNVGSYIFPGDGSAHTGLLVGGKINWTNGYAGVLNSKLIHIGNSTGSLSGDNGNNSNTRVYPTSTSYNNSKRIEGTIDQTPNPSVFQTINYDFEALFTNYRAASNNLGSKINSVQLYNSSNTTISGNNVSSPQIVKITSLSAGFNYLNLTSTSLNNITELNFSGTGFPDASKVLIINVPINSNFSWNNVNSSGLNITTSAPYILWNFYGNTSYTLTIAQSAQIIGTVFAPNFIINKTGTGDIEGSIIAKSSTLGIGEIHYFIFGEYCDILTCTSSPSVNLSGNTTICAGLSTTINAIASGGTGTYTSYSWNNSLGTGTSKTVSPTSTTTYIVTITDSKGCTGTSNITVIVNPKPAVSITGASAICIGTTTTLSPTTGGTWVSSNTSIATVTNAGVVTGIAAGTVTFTFTNTSTGCVSNATNAVTIIARPVVSITGSSSICIGTTTTLSPTSGGTWVSSNTSTATVTSAGVVTGIAAGSVTFTFTNTSTGCISIPTNAITVNAKPTVSITGSTSVCVGGNTTLSPTTGGTWVSSNTAIATVTNAGVVTGIAAGTATFTFTNTTTGCVSNATSTVTIVARPTVSITGATSICEGATTTLSPTTGGTWTSSNTAIATVTNAGVVSGVSGGTVTFTFTNTTTGCTSLPTNTITINPKPVLTYTGPSTICLGGSTSISPTTGGTWTSSNTLVANITNAGVISASLLPGTATFTFTNTSTGCVSNASTALIVTALTSVSITGPSTICVGSTTTLSPSTGGTWTSSNTSVATVNNSGIVTGVGSGTANFTFSNSTTNCLSNATSNITVNAKPTAAITGATSICEGATTTLSPTTGGTWASSNTAIATVTNAGIVTGVSGGTATFTFTNTSTGCTSNPTGSITINAKPIVNITGSNTICESATTTLSPTTGGTWTSSNAAIATISNVGLVTAVSAGTVTFTFTNTSTNCISNPSNVISVNTKPIASITGLSTICAGSTTTLSPTTGGTWLSSNASVATVTNAGVVTGVSAGTASFTFTNSSTGCIANPTSAITINSKPVSTITGSSTICQGATSTLAPSSGGTWASSNTSVATVTNAGVVTGVSAGTATFTFTNTSSGCVSNATGAVTVNAKPIVNITGSSSICAGATTTLSPTTGGTWTSSNSSIATVSSAGVVTGVSSGTVTFIFLNTVSGCMSNPTNAITVNAKPIASVTGSSAICVGGTTTLSPTTGGSWSSSNNSVAVITNAGVVTGVSNGTATFTFTNSTTGCTSLVSAPVTVGSSIQANIDYLGSLCLKNNSQISVSTNNGTAPFTYIWTGPSSFAGNTQTISITNNGNYYVTVTDAVGCSAATSGFVYQKYEPFIVSLQSEVCEGQSVNVSVNSSSAISYQWGSNAGNATTSSVSVTPSYPSSTYAVTVTNDLGCTAVPTATIIAKQKPTVNITGSSSICVGTTTTLSPTSGGTWTSSNTSVATISNTGVVTGVASGTATFTFYNSTTQCTSNPSAPVVVYSKPTAIITGPTNICIESNTSLSPTSGGTWTSNNTSVATVNNSGVVLGVSEGTATFTFTSATTGCVSNPTGTVTVDDKVGVNITGPSTVCMGSTIQVTASKGNGTWSSDDESVAIINNSGVVTPITSGMVIIKYNSNSGSCSNEATHSLIINDKPIVSITGSTTICAGSTTTLSPATGGTWTSSNLSVATVTNAGVVTGLSGGTTTYTFTNTSTGCISNPSNIVTVNPKPVVTFSGPTSICVGATTTLSPSTGGTWVSNNTAIATVTNVGIVTGVSNGNTTFVFTNTLTGCISNATPPLTVGASFDSNIDYLGSVCLTDNSQIRVLTTGGVAPFTYNWSGPSGFSGNAQQVSISSNGNYYVTVTDANGCSDNISGYVYERYEPIIINLNSQICEGHNVNLNVSASNVISYLWSSNAGNATTSNVTVSPSYPSSTYYVSVTNNNGCVAVADATINVYQKPIVNIMGEDSICVSFTTSLSPTSGGSWVSNNPSVATVTNAGVVTGIATGSTTFVFTDNGTNCASNPTAPITINGNTTVTANGPTTICIGDTTYLFPASGGVWSSSNSSVAIINNVGRVIALSSGLATFSFTNSSTGCSSSNGNINVVVNNKPMTVLNGDSEICISGTTNLIPTSGGIWTSNDEAVATITNSGLVTGTGVGTVSFVFTESSTGCNSDNSTPINVVNGTPVNINGDTTICIGSTTHLLPSAGGTWTSENSSIASVTNTGLVTGISSGEAFFTYYNLATGCSSVTDVPITIIAKPIVSINGPSSICIGSTTQMSPSTGGTWISNNPAVATITNSGVVTGLANGSVSFVFTNSNTVCVSNNSPVVTIYSKPNVSITGPSDICIGGTTTLTPTSGGTWTSSNPSIATVSNTGIVTGFSLGSVNFTFFETNSSCVSDQTSNINVISRPATSITGSNNICVGTTTTLYPSTGGAWTSSNSSVATVTNGGIVTGVSQGSATFTYIANGGCISDPTAPVVINGKPSVNVTGPSPICVGSSSQVSPSTGGVWESVSPTIASINNSGVVTGLSQGSARFRFTSSTTNCKSDPSNEIIINSAPVVTLTGANTICIGNTTQVNPTNGGIWVSSNSSIASVNSSGQITGISAGTASFTFTSTTTGCQSQTPITITVNPKPLVSILGSHEICINGSTILSPSVGGTWVSNNPSIASVNNSGLVTGLSQGVAKFYFISNNTGCQSAFTAPIVVNGNPVVLFSGPTDICIGSSTTLSPVSGGTWQSSNTSIANITNNGIATGINEGNVTFTFTDSNTGCTSSPTDDLNVNDAIDVSITGPSQICMGYTTTLSPSVGGFWTSTNEKVASISAAGVVIGNTPGKVSFYFTQAVTGCVSYLPNDAITVENCIDPDFNVTLINNIVNGNLSTNDEIALPTSYSSNYILTSKPSGSLPMLTINTDGTYSFSANMVGNYRYKVPVCISPLTYGCPTSQLSITVVNPFSEEVDIVSNTDISSVYEKLSTNNVQANMKALQNDDCISSTPCDLLTTDMSVFSLPNKGMANISGVSMMYEPILNLVGRDTIISMVCEDGNSSNCAYSDQIITIRHESALNTAVAADDFFNTNAGTSILSNVKYNDSDPEGDNISVLPQGNSSNQIFIPEGSYYILDDGTISFTPNQGFTGSLDIVYTLCDNNSSVACVNATAHILVFGDMSLKIRVYLEGALMNNGNEISSTGRPLMRDNLRQNPFDNSNSIPKQDPYKFGTAFVFVNSNYQHIGSGALSVYDEIVDSAGVFSVEGEDAIVDWVFVEIRSKDDSTNVIATRSGLVQRDGDVVDLDGQSNLYFPGLILDSFYVVVKHRNHLGAMSLIVHRDELIDFTSQYFPVFDFSTRLYSGFDYSELSTNNSIKYGYRALWAGDSNGDGKIKFTNPGDDQNEIFYDVLTDEGNINGNSNFDFTIGYYQGDFNMNGKAKYDNPNDDKNFLFSQILLYDLNSSYLSNFNFFIQQIP